jgi:hypothetical protein
MDVVVRRIVATLSGLALGAVFLMQTATAATTADIGALWSSSYTAPSSDCAGFSRDSNDFCWTEGGDNSPAGPGVELGVRFTSSQDVAITGVRVYRVSPGTVTGHLWNATGRSLLATGTFSGTATHSWQDLFFDTPVAIQAGATYVASYHVPDAQYAIQYDYFAASGQAAGPITALGSADSGGNGVYCYDNDPADCGGLPTNTYRDTNYWVTPLWGYRFSGFVQPVLSGGTATTVKAGSSLPVKFSLDGDQGLGILRAGYPKVTTAPCVNGAPSTSSATTAAAVGGSLQYDAATDQYSYVWKTAATSAGSCARFDLGLDDGSTHTFAARFKK